MSRAYPSSTQVRNVGFHVAMGLRRQYLRRVWGISVGKGARVSLSAKLDKTNPRGVVIGDYAVITFGAAVLTHDFIRRQHLVTTIGANTFIGAHAIIMPGVTVGEGCIVSALALVARDVPPGSVVMGNPARIIEKDIVVGKYGNRIDVGVRA